MTEQMMTKYDTTHEQEFDVTLTQDQYDFISRLIDEEVADPNQRLSGVMYEGMLEEVSKIFIRGYRVWPRKRQGI